MALEVGDRECIDEQLDQRLEDVIQRTVMQRIAAPGFFGCRGPPEPVLPLGPSIIDRD
jgi:hypothetical protein